jgi:RNA polymerase sigma-70 factor (ECF subfamily)
MEPDYDDNLVASYLAGDLAAFDQLFERHRRGLFSYLYSMVRSRADVEDLFQETFLRAIKALPRYRARGKFRAWLYKIARNLARDRVRELMARGKPVRLGTLSSEDVESRQTVLDLPDGRPDPSDAAVSHEKQDWIDRALETLPAPQREVFVLREYAGMPFKEIALVQRRPIGTVLARMHYALEKPRAEPKKEEESY